MPHGKGTYGKKKGRPPENAKKRNKIEYTGNGKIGYSKIGKA